MTAQRGTPSYVILDNGTNFVGAEEEMCKKICELDEDENSEENHPTSQNRVGELSIVCPTFWRSI
jgi:hypothetical protein